VKVVEEDHSRRKSISQLGCNIDSTPSCTNNCN